MSSPLALAPATAGVIPESQNSKKFELQKNLNFSSDQPSNNPTSYRFCFTFNNPGEHLENWDYFVSGYDPESAGAEIEIKELASAYDSFPTWAYHPVIADFLSDPALVSVCIGREFGESGTEHLQGAFAFNTKTRVRWNTLRARSVLFQHYLVVQKGRGDSAYDYCAKDGDFLRKDARKGQGHRSDLAEAIDSIKTTGGIHDVMENHAESYVRYYGGLSRLALACAPRRESFPITYWLYGPTGTNKTRTAYESQAEKQSIWFAPSDLDWFDGYDPSRHTTVIFDDLRASQKTFPLLLRLLDRYPMQVPFKGGFVTWNPSQIFITTPVSPYRMFRDLLRDQDGAFLQLYRRVVDGGGHFVRHHRSEEPCLMSDKQMSDEYHSAFNSQFAVGFNPPRM